MKVALLAPALLIKGGTQRQLLYLAANLKKLNCQVTIFTWVYDSYKCYPGFKNLDIQSIIKKGATPKIINFLSKIISVNRETLYIALLFFKQKQLAKLVIKKGPFNVINSHDWLTYWVAVRVKKKIGIPIMATLNDIPSFTQTKTLQASWTRKLINIVLRRYDRYYCKEIDRILVLDYWNKRKADNYYPVKSTVIRSGIDLDRFIPQELDSFAIRGKLKIPNDTFILLCASILSPQRRFEDVILALKKLIDEGRQVKLIIVGDSSFAPQYASQLHNLVQKLRLTDFVMFVDTFLSDKERMEYYAGCDCFIFPNEKQTWGLSVIEAMALGKPCIVSTGAGVHEVLEDGQTALLVPPRNPTKIYEATKKYMCNVILKKKISYRGQEFVHQTFSWEKYAQNVLNIFQEAYREK